MLYNSYYLYVKFLSNLTNLISFHISNFISKLYSMVLNFHLQDLVTSEELWSLLEQVLLGLLNGILSLLDNDNNPESPDPGGEDPEDPDPEREDPYPGGEDPDDNKPDKPDKDDSDTDKDDSDTDQDSPPTKKLDKGKGRAITPEALPDSPLIPEEPLVPEQDDKNFQEQWEKAKVNSLKVDEESDEEKGGGESSKQGAQREIEELGKKEEIKRKYNKAVQDFNDNQSLLVDNDNLDPSVKEYLIDQSQKLRETVDHYKSVKEDLEIDSSEPEESGSEYDSESSDSDSENSRPSKRPKNK